MRLIAVMLGAVLVAPALADDIHPLFPEGKSLYKQFCAHCHGIDMINPGTGSYDLRKFPQSDKPRFVTAVAKGKGDMPAWGDILLAEEIDAIWVYVASRAGKEPVPDQNAQVPAVPALPGVATLTACLARNGGAMSGWRHSGGTGFDYATLIAIARTLEVDLSVVWFEGEQDEFANPVNEAYAMLSHGLCDVVAAHPVMPGATGPPQVPSATLPRWTGMPTVHDVHSHVTLSPVAGTAPYRRVELGIVVGGAARHGRYDDLADLAGTRIGVQQGTMGEAILRRQGPAKAMKDAITVPPGPKFLWDMEIGLFNATLIGTEAFDFHRRQNSITKLKLTDYRHPLGLDISLAVLQDRFDLLAALNGAIGALAAAGVFEELARAERVTYAAPRGGVPPGLRAALR